MGEVGTEKKREAMTPHGRQLTALISFCAGLVVIASAEAVLLAQAQAFEIWTSWFPDAGGGEYSAWILTRFLSEILVPAALALYTYFTIRSLGTPPSYRFIWGALVFVAAMWKFLTFQTQSPIWYLTLLLWAGLFLTVINIHRLKQESSGKGQA